MTDKIDDLSQFVTDSIVKAHNTIQAAKFVIARINTKTNNNPSEEQKKTISEMEKAITIAEGQIDKLTGQPPK